MTPNELNAVCDILREYYADATAADNGAPTIYEADYARRIEAIIG